MILGHGTADGPKVAEWCVMLSIYIPCLIMILRRPNEGKMPGWVERAIIRIRALLDSARVAQM